MNNEVFMYQYIIIIIITLYPSILQPEDQVGDASPNLTSAMLIGATGAAGKGKSNGARQS